MVAPIRLLALDIDGVLTDGTARLDPGGNISKQIAFHDLDAITTLRREGLAVALVTGEEDALVDAVAHRFAVTTVVRGAKQKLGAIEQLARKQGIGLGEVCYVGDSDRDAAALAAVGLGLAPSNAAPAARAAAHRTLIARGGFGAAAEAARLVQQLNRMLLEDDDNRAELRAIVGDSINAHQRLLETSLPVLSRIAFELMSAFTAGRKVLLFGNGGSAADAQHVAGELVGRFATDSDPWPALALTTDTSVLTCVANDWEYAEVFRRQIRALARAGDVAVGISTSGRSPNVLRGLEAARVLGAVTIGYAGRSAGPMAELCDVCFCAPAEATPRIQELHLLGWHAVCELVERRLVSGYSGGR